MNDNRSPEAQSRIDRWLDLINKPRTVVTKNMSPQERVQEYLKDAEARFSGGSAANKESYLELIEAVKEIAKFIFGEGEKRQ